MKIPPPLLLTVLVAVCLAPFLAKAVHVDDTLFVWTARQIAQHPGNPYGFEVNWYTHPQPMWEVTQNPPLASYYMAAAAAMTGWSETALHAAFLLPAIAAIVGTYLVARKLTSRAFLAALITLLSPAFLVSSTGLMCDTMMLAWWMLAVLAWMEGLERKRTTLLAVSSMLVAVCALTKYFGLALIPLLLAFSLAKRRRPGKWIAWLILPAAVLGAYEFWTQALYGNGMLTGAVQYASTLSALSNKLSSGLYAVLVGLGFAGACALPALTFGPVIWPRRAILLVLVLGAAAAAGLALNPRGSPYVAADYRVFLGLQMALFLAAGTSALALALSDWWRERDAGSVLLLLWTAGTLVFASLLNWTVNARSVLPMIPAVAILIARRPEMQAGRLAQAKLAIPLAVSAAVSLWVTWADVRLADSSRVAAQSFHQRSGKVKINFEGHWGFQYYMQAYGFSPVDSQDFQFADGDLVIVPHNNSNTSVYSLPAAWIASREELTFPTGAGASTMNTAMGAGFYSNLWGPLPFAFGRVAPEAYTVFHLQHVK